MNNRSYALRAGLFVLIFVIAILAAAFWIGGDHESQAPYMVVTHGSVFGLKSQSTVLFRGITAGTVRSIRVDPQNPRMIWIAISVDKNIPVTRGTYAQLKLQGVTGLSALELNTTADLAPLPTSRAHPGEIPMRPSLLSRLTTAGAHAMKQLTQLSRALHQTLDAANRAHLQTILANAARASQQWSTLSRHLNNAVAALPGVEKHADLALTHINQLTQHMRALGRHLQALSDSAQGASTVILTRTLPRIDRAISHLTAASDDVQKLSRSLRHHPRELLLGARPMAPGPGEPGYQESH